MTVMPFCMRCGASGVVTYGSLCGQCIAAEEREEEARRG
jgi:NMD protein affecting ribosome stability and mRNA decay